MIAKHLASYKYAMRGIWLAFRYEPTMIIHLIAAMVVLALNFGLAVSKIDWILTLALIGIVWMAEIFNTAIEKLANRITREHDPMIGEAKDLSAGAVLVIGIAAAICGAIIYWPYVR